jgi:DNA-binding NarL/FixJ family response regulator
MTIRILIADDHGLMRQGLRLLLEQSPDMIVVGEAEDGRAAVEMAATLFPDVVLMDISMSGLNGLDATRLITSQSRRVKVIMLSMHANEAYLRHALQAGAQGYVLKHGIKEELTEAIHTVLRDEQFITPQMAQAPAPDEPGRQDDTVLPSTRLETLTPREREILQLIAEGLSNQDIASRLVISTKTVDRHRANLMEKLDIHNTAGLVRFAIQSGLISLDE